MKATKDKLEPEFEPFTLNIMVESKEDLKYLWHIFNESEAKIIKESMAEYAKYPLLLESGDYGTSSIWRLIGEEISEED